MHWVDLVAEELLRRGKKHVIASGTSISGHIHIGHCNDIFIADAIRKAVEEKGGEARAIWYADDFDPLRKVPTYLPERFKEYLGMPYANLPSPQSGFKNFVDYFVQPLLKTLGSFGVNVEVFYGSEVYRSGLLAPLIRQSLEKADTIRQILNRFRSTPLPDDWLPYNPLCSKCGRIATTKAFDWQGDYVFYRCVGCEYVKGCGNEGEANYTRGEGKLTWRVEWPARWKLLGVTCEPFGKDHAEAGGSYDTGKLIVKEVFEGEPPYPVPYEWVSLSGARMSSSKGVVFTLEEWLRIAEPEILRFFIFRSKPMKSKNFDPGLYLLNLYEEFDELEKQYFQGIAGERARIYELSLTDSPPSTPPERLPIRLCAILCQLAPDWERVKEIIISRKLLENPNEQNLKLAEKRVGVMREWIREYAPPEMRVKIIEKAPSVRLTKEEREALEDLCNQLESRELSSLEIHNLIYSIASFRGVKAERLFELIYLAFLGKEKGPRAGTLLRVLDKDFVLSRLREFMTSAPPL